jgi:alkanesulfonate monooxygenase SsuD/methylene tetrahydromethanopterin reductase-like flavin-dependent oxidoreductase (luciferase family)
VAKQVATLDLFSEGRLVFGVGVGGEFPVEYELCGVPITERGARLSEGIAVVKKLWSGEPVSNDGPIYPFPEVRMLPAPAQSGGPPVWCGGRSKAALERAGRLADGWVSYVTTPETYRQSLDAIAAAAHGRDLHTFGTGHLLFARIDDEYETSLDLAAESLSVRYAMDFRSAAKRFAALGPPESIAATLNNFFEAGVRHVIMDFVGPYETRPDQIVRFAEEVRPLLGDICGPGSGGYNPQPGTGP